MSVKQQLPSLSLLCSIYEVVPEQTLDEADVDSYFYRNILDVTKTDNRLVRVGKGSNENLFAIKVFKFCDLKAQQRFLLDEEISITKKARCNPQQTASLFKTVRPRTKGNSISLPKPLQEIGFTLWKDELFSHYYLDIEEHTDRHLRLFFRFEKDKNCCCSLKKFLYRGNQFVLTEIVNLSHNELYELYKDRYFISSKSGIRRLATTTSNGAQHSYKHNRGRLLP